MFNIRDYDKNKILCMMEGISGSGKTTLCNILAQYLPDACILTEPFERWNTIGTTGNLFANFVQDPVRWGFTFELYAFITHCQDLEKAYKDNATKELFITDRSYFSSLYIFSKVYYEMGSFSSMELQIFQEIVQWTINQLPYRPDGFIYLQVTPQTAFTRYLTRNREHDIAFNADFLEKLYKHHEDWLVHKKDIPDYLKKVPVLILDGNVDFEHDLKAQQLLVAQVQEFAQSLARQKASSRLG